MYFYTVSSFQSVLLRTYHKFLQNVKSDVSQSEVTLYNDVEFGAIYRKIYYSKFMTLSNQTSPYIRKCIRHFQGKNCHFHVCLPFKWCLFLNRKNLLLQEQIPSFKSGYPFLWASFMREADRKSQNLSTMF